jgi:uncharacterized protein YbjT (DUF2867 family)
MTEQCSVRALLIGATGPTGREVLAKATAISWRLRAMARKPDVLSSIAGEHDVVRGDVTDRVSLEAAMAGVDTVISVLGSPFTMKPVSLLSEGTKNILSAMRAAGARRLICITGMGAGDSRGHGGFLYDQIILPLLLGRIYADKDRQEAIVSASDVDWLLVRPAFLTNGAAAAQYRILTDLSRRQQTRISRKDVAEFIVGEASAQKFSRQTVNLSN